MKIASLDQILNNIGGKFDPGHLRVYGCIDHRRPFTGITNEDDFIFKYGWYFFYFQDINKGVIWKRPTATFESDQNLSVHGND